MSSRLSAVAQQLRDIDKALAWRPIDSLMPPKPALSWRGGVSPVYH
jgi:hypothetical protein